MKRRGAKSEEERSEMESSEEERSEEVRSEEERVEEKRSNEERGAEKKSRETRVKESGEKETRATDRLHARTILIFEAKPYSQYSPLNLREAAHGDGQG